MTFDLRLFIVTIGPLEPAFLLSLALASLVVMLHPNGNVAIAAAVFTLPATIYGIWRHRQVAGPKGEWQPQPVS